MATISEVSSDYGVDEELSRDLQALREILENEELPLQSGSDTQDADTNESQGPLEGLQKCLSKNRELQAQLQRELVKIRGALAQNQQKRNFLTSPPQGIAFTRALSMWKFRRGMYFKNRRGKSFKSEIVIPTPPSTSPYNYHLNCSMWRKDKEEKKLLDTLNVQMIEKHSRPMIDELANTKDKEEIRKLRKMIADMRYLDSKDLFSISEDIEFDWNQVADAAFNGSKLAIDCKLHWENVLNPLINSEPWSKEEDLELINLASLYNYADWQAIARGIRTKRTAFDCLKRYQLAFGGTITSNKFKWTSEQDQRLREGVEKYGEKRWRAVSNYVGYGRTHNQCLHRWFNTINPGIKKGRWSKSEDELLNKAVETHGAGNWARIAIHVPSRTAVQCRERWVNVLDKNLKKGAWSKEEEDKLIALCSAYEGRPIKWSKVALELGNRTDAMCSHHWRSLSSTSEVVKQYASRVKEKALHSGRKHLHQTALASDDVEAELLPGNVRDKVDAYERRIKKTKTPTVKKLINFSPRTKKSPPKTRKTSTCKSSTSLDGASSTITRPHEYVQPDQSLLPPPCISTSVGSSTYTSLHQPTCTIQVVSISPTVTSSTNTVTSSPYSVSATTTLRSSTGTLSLSSEEQSFPMCPRFITLPLLPESRRSSHRIRKVPTSQEDEVHVTPSTTQAVSVASTQPIETAVSALLSLSNDSQPLNQPVATTEDVTVTPEQMVYSLLSATNEVTSVISVPEAVPCLSALPVDSETLKWANDKGVPVTRVDGPSLIGSSQDDDTESDEEYLPYSETHTQDLETSEDSLVYSPLAPRLSCGDNTDENGVSYSARESNVCSTLAEMAGPSFVRADDVSTCINQLVTCEEMECCHAGDPEPLCSHDDVVEVSCIDSTTSPTASTARVDTVNTATTTTNTQSKNNNTVNLSSVTSTQSQKRTTQRRRYSKKNKPSDKTTLTRTCTTEQNDVSEPTESGELSASETGKTLRNKSSANSKATTSSRQRQTVTKRSKTVAASRKTGVNKTATTSSVRSQRKRGRSSKDDSEEVAAISQGAGPTPKKRQRSSSTKVPSKPTLSSNKKRRSSRRK